MREFAIQRPAVEFQGQFEVAEIDGEGEADDADEKEE